MSQITHPVVLLILDGFGHREASDNNAIYHAKTPHLDRLSQDYTKTLISGSGDDVGLPSGQMGNSEVGHLNLGAGRVVYQDFTRISKAIKDGDFADNPTLCQAIDDAVAKQGAVHMMGLLSPGGVHSHEAHIIACIQLAAQRGAAAIYVHGFLDGRDTPPRSAADSLASIDQALTATGKGRIASLIGRYYAMDRDQRWERIQAAYDLLTLGQAEFRASSATAALEAAYARDENDEFVQATVITDAQGQGATLQDNDSVIFVNFRADRARQLSRAFVQDDFSGFTRTQRPRLSHFVGMTQYAEDIATEVAFPPSLLANTLGEYLSQQGLRQLRIAETEKYAHVTFFFSGGREQPYDGEQRILVPSPDVATYDLQPEMSAQQVTDKLCAALRNREFDTIICNYANGDMVGHTGNFDAAVKAVETLDHCVQQVVDAAQAVGAELIITADHGNAECMHDHSTGQAHTAHTSEPVPCWYIGRQAQLRDGGVLSDIAPTLLHMMGLSQPTEMTGQSLIEHFN